MCCKDRSIHPTIENKLLNIAKQTVTEFSGETRTDLQTHGTDSEDFFDIAIWEFRAALIAAYNEGKGDAL